MGQKIKGKNMSKSVLYNFDIKLNRDLWESSGIKSSNVYAREAFIERTLTNALYFDCNQIVEIASRSDFRFAARNNINYYSCNILDVNWYEQLINEGFNPYKSSFILGCELVFSIERDEFINLLQSLKNLMTEGSSFVFSYPVTKYETFELEVLLSTYGFRVYEHLDSQEVEEQLFYKYNLINSKRKIIPPEGVNYCLAVRK